MRASSTTKWLWWLGGLTGAVLAVLALAVGPGLVVGSSGVALTAEQRLRAENAVRTVMVQALGGLALAGGLIVTYRTFLLNRAEQHRSFDLRQAEQVTAFFAKAVEQLGDDKAPVRLGALYALERLAQNNAGQRPTVVDVLCAYLRMPYEMPGDEPAADRAEARDRAQELEVRRTAQEILAEHGRPGNGELFWPGCRINLSGAVLVNVDFGGCRLASARFLKARFRGPAIFHGATFEGDATFAGATFDKRIDAYLGRRRWYLADAGFDQAQFLGQATFFECAFSGRVSFNAATFHGGAAFAKATFSIRKALSGPGRPWISLSRAQVAASAARDSTWPPGWRVRPEAAESGWVTIEEEPPAWGGPPGGLHEGGDTG